MNCRDCRRYALLEGSGELSGRRLRSLQRHVSGCAACRAYRQELNGICAAAREHLAGGAPTGATLARIREQAQRARPARVLPFPHAVPRVLACAASVALIAGAWFAFTQRGTPDRVGEIDAILAVLSTDDTDAWEPAGNLPRDEQIRTLAQRLLILQGFVDDTDPEEDSATLPGAPEPTDVQSRSSGAYPPGRCV